MEFAPRSITCFARLPMYLTAMPLAVIMTGMGRDGLAGCQQLKQAGGYVFAQCQDDCVVYGMPKAVIEEDLADRILPLGKIAPAIVRHLKRSRRRSCRRGIS